MDCHSEPFEHALIDDFLADDLFTRLCDAVGELVVTRIESDLFSFEQSEDLTKSPEPAFQEFQKKLLELAPEFEKTYDIHVATTDLMSSFYYDGDHLLPHDDRLEKRKIAYILYLTVPEEGGELALFDKGEPAKEIVPVTNRLVLFPVSKRSIHAVKEILGKKPRISLSGWFS